MLFVLQEWPIWMIKNIYIYTLTQWRDTEVMFVFKYKQHKLLTSIWTEGICPETEKVVLGFKFGWFFAFKKLFECVFLLSWWESFFVLFHLKLAVEENFIKSDLTPQCIIY